MLESKLNQIPSISLLSRVGVGGGGWGWVGGIKIKANSARLGLPVWAQLGKKMKWKIKVCWLHKCAWFWQDALASEYSVLQSMDHIVNIIQKLKGIYEIINDSFGALKLKYTNKLRYIFALRWKLLTTPNSKNVFWYEILLTVCLFQFINNVCVLFTSITQILHWNNNV